MHLLYESLVGKCEYTTQSKGSFWCHVIDAKVAALLLIFMNKFVLVLYLSFSFRYVVELKLLQNLKNVNQTGLSLGMGISITCKISRLMRYGKLSCIEFNSCFLQQYLSIDLFSYWTPVCGQKGPINKVCLSVLFRSILRIGYLVSSSFFSMVLGVHMV